MTSDCLGAARGLGRIRRAALDSSQSSEGPSSHLPTSVGSVRAAEAPLVQALEPEEAHVSVAILWPSLAWTVLTLAPVHSIVQGMWAVGPHEPSDRTGQLDPRLLGLMPSGYGIGVRQTLVDVALTLASSRRRAILGLAGPPGAGKSVLAALIVQDAKRQLGEAAVGFVPLDGFHLSNAQLQLLERQGRKGAPDTFDVWGYLALIQRILAKPDVDVYVPEYDRALHEPVAARLVVEPEAKLIVTEGNYLALDQPGWRDIGALLSELWYVDAPDDVRIERLVARQVAGGLDKESARDWVYNNDRPNGELVKQTKARCVRVITSPDVGVP